MCGELCDSSMVLIIEGVVALRKGMSRLPGPLHNKIKECYLVGMEIHQDRILESEQVRETWDR